MTERESLEITIRMWDWLAENPTASKNDAIHALGLNLKMEGSGCALCAYVEQECGTESLDEDWFDCTICPMLDFWLSFSEEENKEIPSACTHPMTPYSCWRIYNPSTPYAGQLTRYNRSLVARQIADGAREALAKLTQ